LNGSEFITFAFSVALGFITITMTGELVHVGGGKGKIFDGSHRRFGWRIGL